MTGTRILVASSGGRGNEVQHRAVSELMTTAVVAVRTNTPAPDAERLMRERNIQHLVVTVGRAVVGVVCACDLAEARSHWRIIDCLKREALVVNAATSSDEAARIMKESSVGALPVVDDDEHLVGILTRGDLRRAGMSSRRLGSVCRACGGLHHVRGQVDDAAYCLDCFDPRAIAWTSDPYRELGVGD